MQRSNAIAINVGKEFELSKELKSLCHQHDGKWKENNPHQSAQVLCKLGLFRKGKCLVTNENSMDRKFSFIQFAALLNCALVRNQLSETKNDLQDLCSELLKAADAKQQEFDLMEFSSSLKNQIQNWRNHLKREVNNITAIPDEADEENLSCLEQEKVKDVRRLQTQITEKYKSLMAQVSDTCIRVLGKIPCQYALVGMGSMAREEITPFSDFENMILLQEGVQCRKNEEYEQILEYFRWYAVMFQVILINLGETILPSVAIPSLNDFITPGGDWFYDAFTTRGISFDGMMPHACKSPLGRQQILENKPWKTELIKPISEMVRYLDQEEDLKNGYHLADILTSTCRVAGSETLYETFETSVRKKLTDSRNNTKEAITKVIKDDMKTYSTKLSLFATIQNDSYNVKQFVYRSTTIFIAGLAKMHNIKSGSCFDIILRMSEKNLIADAFKQKLQYAVAIACEIRLKTYLNKNCQDDYVAFDVEDDHDIASTLIKIVGKRSCYDYFEIACCLQYDVIAHLNLSDDYMYFHPVTMSIAISSFFQLYDRIHAAQYYIDEHPIYLDQPVSNDDDDFYDHMEDVDDDEYYDDVAAVEAKSCDDSSYEKEACMETAVDVSCEKAIGKWHSRMQSFNQKFFQYLKKVALNTSEFQIKNISDVLIKFGKYFFDKQIYSESLTCFKIALKLLQAVEDKEKNCKAALCIYMSGKCFCGLQQSDMGLNKIQESLEFYKGLPIIDQVMDGFEADCYKALAQSEIKMGEKEKATGNYEKAIKLYSFSKNIKDIMICLLQYGHCLRHLKRFKEAKIQYQLLLSHVHKDEKTFSVHGKETLIVWSTYYVGICSAKLSCFEEAIKHYESAVELLPSDQMEVREVEHIRARCWQSKGISLASLGKHSESRESFFRSIESWKNLCDGKRYSSNLSYCYKRIALTYKSENLHEKSAETFLEALNTLKEQTDQSFADVSSSALNVHLGETYYTLKKFDKAKKYYNKAFLGLKETDRKDGKTAHLCRKFSVRLQKLNEKKKAEELAKKAIVIFRELLQSKPTNISYLKDIGICYQIIAEDEQALLYLKDCLKLFDEQNLSDPWEHAHVLKRISVSLTQQRKYEDAVEFFEKSKKKFEVVQKSARFTQEVELELAKLHNRIGWHYLYRENLEYAKACFNNCVALLEKLRPTIPAIHIHSRALYNLGHYYSKKQQLKDAVQCYEKAKVLLFQIQQKTNRQKFEEGLTLKCLGLCYKTQGNLREADEALQTSLSCFKNCFKSSRRTHETAFILKNLGYVSRDLCKYAKAKEYFEQSLEEYEGMHRSWRYGADIESIRSAISHCNALMEVRDF